MRTRKKAEKLLDRLGLGGFYVYKLYDAKDALQYIGSSSNVKARVRAHYNNTDNPWIIKSTRIEISEPYSKESEARDAEKHAIKEEDPQHNKTHRPPRLARHRWKSRYGRTFEQG